MCVGLVSLGGPDLDFEIEVRDDDGTDGGPGTLLGAVPVSATGIPGGLPCAFYEVDISSLGLNIPDGNGVFEPGELVDVAPAWVNLGLMPHDVFGSAASFTGPAGPTYSLEDADADYGMVDPKQTASCRDSGDCYQMEVGPTGVERPALHWDASFDETLSEESAKTWALHIGDSFTDVPRTSLFYPWIEDLAGRGVTAGCGGGNYCPNSSVSRDQIAAFLLKTLEGSGYVPPECTGVFADVPCPSLFADWIEDLVARGVTAGCGGGNYCPANPVTRDQMAVFLSKAFGLSLYGP